MKRITHITMAISFTLAIAMRVGPAAADQPANDETIPVRHHLLYGSVIPSATDAPYGTPGELYACLSCHAVDASSESSQFVIGRDCQVCHSADRHHVLYDSVIPQATEAPYGTSGETFVCFSCHEAYTSSGDVQFLVERDCHVCHQASGVTNILVDIMPGSDENPVNLTSKGVLPVAILGTTDCDVTEIDVSSLLLEGQVAPLRSRLQNRAHGYKNLALKFAVEDVSSAIGSLQPGQTYEIWITGILNDGTAISGSDFIVAVPNGRGYCPDRLQEHFKDSFKNLFPDHFKGIAKDRGRGRRR